MAVLKKRGPQTKAQSKELVIAKMKEDIQDLREHQNRLQASEEATSSTKMTNEQKNKAQASSAAASSSSSARPAGLVSVPKAAMHDKGGFRDDESKMDRKAMGRKATREFVMGRFREWEARPPWFSHEPFYHELTHYAVGYLKETRFGCRLLEIGVLSFWLCWSVEPPPAISATEEQATGQPVFYVVTRDGAEHTIFPCKFPTECRKGADTVLWI